MDYVLFLLSLINIVDPGNISPRFKDILTT